MRDRRPWYERDLNLIEFIESPLAKLEKMADKINEWLTRRYTHQSI